jgi:hypothetical protein
LLEQPRRATTHLLVAADSGVAQYLGCGLLIGFGILGILGESRLDPGMGQPELVDDQGLQANIAILDAWSETGFTTVPARTALSKTAIGSMWLPSTKSLIPSN